MLLKKKSLQLLFNIPFIFSMQQGNAKNAIENILETPNILVVVCEDISPYLGCYGDSIAVSPNIDKFAERGIRHTNMFTCVGVSAPSRYSLITGRYSSSDGANFMRSNYFNSDFSVVAPDGVKCYTEYLRLKGYYCTNNAKTDYQFKVPLSAWDECGSKAHWRNADVNQPFYAIVNLNITHESYIWKNTNDSLVVNPKHVFIPPYYPDTETVRHDHAVLYSNIAKMDLQFQSIINELEDSGRADNTIIIFYSDNGGPLPRGKREILDSGTRVPFLIKFPNNYRENTINEELNMFVDIPATILSLAGIEPPAYMHGQAMYGKYAKDNMRKYVFGATDRFDDQIEKRGMIRTDKYLYLYNYMPNQSIYRPIKFRLAMPMMREMIALSENKELNEVQMKWFNDKAEIEELYDCEKDPFQINNLAYNEDYIIILEEMRKKYRTEWIEPYNAEWELYPESYFVEKMWKNGNKPKCEEPKFNISGDYVSIINNPDINSISYRIINLDKKWNIYNVPVKLNHGDEMEIIIERIGYEPSKKFITNI